MAGSSVPLAGAAVWTSGHGDLSAEYLAAPDEAFELVVHLEGGVVDGIPTEGEIEAGELMIGVPLSTWQFIDANGGRPGGAAWDPIGVSAGEPYWFLPMSDGGPGGASTLGAPFVGWGLEELDPAEWQGDLVFTLTGVEHPGGGHFSVWNIPIADPQFLVASSDGIDAFDAISLTPGSHTHFNLGFTQPGLYEVSFRVDGTLAAGGGVTGSGTYQFAVVPEPRAGLLGLLGLAVLGLRRSRPVRRCAG